MHIQKRPSKLSPEQTARVILGLMPIMQGRSFIRGRKEATLTPVLDIEVRHEGDHVKRPSQCLAPRTALGSGGRMFCERSFSVFVF